jgi:hypothetical protein
VYDVRVHKYRIRIKSARSFRSYGGAHAYRQRNTNSKNDVLVFGRVERFNTCKSVRLSSSLFIIIIYSLSKQGKKKKILEQERRKKNMRKRRREQ